MAVPSAAGNTQTPRQVGRTAESRAGITLSPSRTRDARQQSRLYGAKRPSRSFAIHNATDHEPEAVPDSRWGRGGAPSRSVTKMRSQSVICGDQTQEQRAVGGAAEAPANCVSTSLSVTSRGPAWIRVTCSPSALVIG
jgi:hypothetical protein